MRLIFRQVEIDLHGATMRRRRLQPRAPRARRDRRSQPRRARTRPLSPSNRATESRERAAYAIDQDALKPLDPRSQSRSGPLAPIMALSDEEKIALFS